MAEAQTQLVGRDAEAGNMKIDSSTKVAGHCAKRQGLAACEDVVDQKDERSGLMIANTPSWKERLQGMYLMKLAEQLDRTKVTVLICYSK